MTCMSSVRLCWSEWQARHLRLAKLPPSSAFPSADVRCAPVWPPGRARPLPARPTLAAGACGILYLDWCGKWIFFGWKRFCCFLFWLLSASRGASDMERPPSRVVRWFSDCERGTRRLRHVFCQPLPRSSCAWGLLLPWIPIPHPVVPDEFSHILLAKTLLLGRLANPPHPLWQHFESIHILSQPTYSSMYMAGQACFLAAGQFLFGNLFWGVVLSTALFCGAVTWFLRAYVPPGWALFGGMLAAVRIGAASYWNNSYWGGSAGALGGAMVLGAYPRLVKTWKPLPALIFAAGLVLLANTLPLRRRYSGGAVLVTSAGGGMVLASAKPRE